jgi:hypothetical protein
MAQMAIASINEKFAALPAHEQALLPGPQDVEFYREHGYWISPPLFSNEEIDEALFGAERFYAGDYDFHLADRLHMFSGWKPDDGDGLRINDYVALRNRELSAIALHRLIGAIAARLCESSAIRLWHDQLIYKPGADAGCTAGIGWHTDRAYWQTCSSTEMLTAWIPLHDADEEIGTLQIIDRSHAWAGDTAIRGFHEQTLRSAAAYRDGSEAAAPTVLPMILRKGQVSFHHCRTIHGSGPNLTSRPRQTISVHLQDEGNRYRAATQHDGEPAWHRNDVLCRKHDGIPDYSDPDLCPVLWPA